jgi:hypothetical protein
MAGLVVHNAASYEGGQGLAGGADTGADREMLCVAICL